MREEWQESRLHRYRQFLKGLVVQIKDLDSILRLWGIIESFTAGGGGVGIFRVRVLGRSFLLVHRERVRE